MPFRFRNSGKVRQRTIDTAQQEYARASVMVEEGQSLLDEIRRDLAPICSELADGPSKLTSGND